MTSLTSRTRAGFTMIEVAISMLVVGILFAAALHTLGASRLGQRSIADQQRAIFLAQDLLSEVIQQPYADPDSAPVLGPEPGESASTRRDFDDVDDYATWRAAPPRHPGGDAIAGFSDWWREVTVTRITAAGQPAAVDTGLKRVDVVVGRGTRELVRLSAVRSRAWDAADGGGGMP